MNSYHEKLAPIFSQILLQKEYEQIQILRSSYERFRTRPFALSHLTQDYSAFDQAAHMFTELDRARQRIREKSYGKCSDCGCDIDLLRLNAHPAALHCQNCDYKRDRVKLRAERKCA